MKKSIASEKKTISVGTRFVYKIPYRRAPRLAFRPIASREQRYLAYKDKIEATIFNLMSYDVFSKNVLV